MSNRGGRRFTTGRFPNSRGGQGGRGQNSFNSGAQFTGYQNGGQNFSRPPINKPKVCMFFQQGMCNNANCPSQHQYSYNNEIGRLQQISVNMPIFASCMVSQSKIAVALSGKIAIYEVTNGEIITELQIQGKTKCLVYASDLAGGTLLFCGEAQRGQLLGAIGSGGNIFNFPAAHNGGVNCMIIKGNLIFAGGDDAKVSVWYFSGQGFALGMTMDIDAAMQSQICCMEFVGNTLIAGLFNGFVVGWDYNFESNQCTWKGNLHLIHKGKVTSLVVLNDNYIFSGGEDGMINCWDASSGFNGGSLLNITKNKPMQISQMSICECSNGTALLVATTSGKILWYILQQSDAKFFQPLNYHKKAITGLKLFENLHNFNGFITTSIDGLIIVSNWN